MAGSPATRASSTIVDGMGVGVGEAEIGSAGHAAVDGNSCAVVEAGGGALEFIDFAELGDGRPSGLMQGGNGHVRDCVYCQVAKESTV